MLAAELPARTKWAVTEGAAALKDRAEIGGLAAGASGSEPREAAFTEIGDGGGDESPAVVSGSSTGDAGGAPGGPGLLPIRGDPGSNRIKAPTAAAEFKEPGSVGGRPGSDDSRNAGGEEAQNVVGSREGAGVGESSPLPADRCPPLPVGRAPGGPGNEGENMIFFSRKDRTHPRGGRRGEKKAEEGGEIFFLSCTHL